jgi:hypothetical protein
MPEVSTFRLNLLRVTYLILIVGLGISLWPGILNPPPDLPVMKSAVRSLLGALSLLAILGLRYPLKMLPLLVFELTWKTIWLLAFALPRWIGGRMDADYREMWNSCVGVVILIPIIPWRYLFTHYVKAPGDRWRSAA